MPTPLRYTLLGDGSSDRCLGPVINWTLQQIPGLREAGFTPQVADLRDLPEPVTELRQRIETALRYFPCEVLFVHRDAEGAPPEDRFQEIRRATAEMSSPPHVAIVPVRMTEAWLLISDVAIRHAADNPHGTCSLPLPVIRRLESLPDPKVTLHQCLITASEKRGRRLDQFKRDLPYRVHRVAEMIADFSSLRQLDAFSRFEQDTHAAVQALL